MQECQFKLDNFEGPLELLMHLIEKHKIDIYDIPIVNITSQYMEYIEEWNKFDISYSTEFLVMAATLLQIKSRLLLPQKENDDLNESDDPRNELVERLLEFQEIKKVAKIIEERVESNSNVFTRPEELSEYGTKASFDLSKIPFYKIFYEALQETTEEENEVEKVVVEKEKFSMDDAIRTVLNEVGTEKTVLYKEFIHKFKSRHVLVTIFLAILELLKVQLIDIAQDDLDNIILKEGNNNG